jgi:hypothetical protein
MFCTFKLRFEENVLTFFWFGNCFGYFIKNFGQIFPQSSGRPALRPEVDVVLVRSHLIREAGIPYLL